MVPVASRLGTDSSGLDLGGLDHQMMANVASFRMWDFLMTILMTTMSTFDFESYCHDSRLAVHI